jgi:hypothetical protein
MLNKLITIVSTILCLNLLWIIIQEGIYSDVQRIRGGFFVNPNINLNYYAIIPLLLILIFLIIKNKKK